MNQILQYLFGQPTNVTMMYALTFLRIAMGLLTIPHGYPKIIGGVAGWEKIGVNFMGPLGIHFLPVIWGFLAAITEFVGGILFTIGLGTRIVSFFLVIMMIIAAAWHLQQGDPFMKYSFALTLVVVFLTFMIIGGGHYSLDWYLSKNKFLIIFFE